MLSTQETRLNDKEIEAEIVAKGLTARRVTPEQVAATVVSEWYFTAAQGVYGANGENAPGNEGEIPQSLHLLTICTLVLQNGFTVMGTSACASPENFDAALGRKIARQNAAQQIWALEGYQLRTALHNRAHAAAVGYGA